jgi:parallel beta-helix repeat protein
MASIGIPNLSLAMTAGTTIAGNTIRNEYFGIYFQNTTVGTTVLQNAIDPSVKVPLTGVSLTATPPAMTTISSVTTVSSIATVSSSTAEIVAYAALLVAIVLGGAALVVARKKPKAAS